MTTANQQSTETLCAEILNTAHQEREEILGRAQTDAEKILASGRAAAEKIRNDQEKLAKAEAVRSRERILATVAVEIGRLKSKQIETQLELIRTEIQRRLNAQNQASRETIVALAAEAIRRMPENKFLVQICSADHEFIDDRLPEEISKRAGRSPLNVAITVNGSTGTGVIVRDAGGLQIWDNRLLKRLDRLWPELRRQIVVQIPIFGSNHFAGGKT